jgi:hypothetical protein
LAEAGEHRFALAALAYEGADQHDAFLGRRFDNQTVGGGDFLVLPPKGDAVSGSKGQRRAPRG